MCNLFKVSNRYNRTKSISLILHKLTISRRGEVNLTPSLKIKREIWRQILIAVTLFTLFLNHLIEQICTLYTLNLFIVESVNCLGKKYVQGWKMYFHGFNGIIR